MSEENSGISEGLIVLSGNTVTVGSGSSAVGTKVEGGGVLYVEDDGYASGTTVDYDGQLIVLAGGTVTDLAPAEGALLTLCVDADTYVTGTINSEEFTISGGKAENVTVAGYNSSLKISHLYLGSGTRAVDTDVLLNGYLYVADGGYAFNSEIQNFGYLEISSGGFAENTVIDSATAYIFGTHSGTLSISSVAEIVTGTTTKIDFTVKNMTVSDDYLITNISKLGSEPTYSITVDASQAGGVYKLATNASAFSNTVSIGDGTNVFGTLSVNGETVESGNYSYTLVREDTYLTLRVDVEMSGTGSASGSEWMEIADVDYYIIEYSTDNFVSAVQIISETNSFSTAGLPAGTYQWRVRTPGYDEWSVQENIVVEAPADDSPQRFEAVEDDVKDVFFASANGKWRASHKACHTGSIGDSSWTGTNETVRLSNKGKIADCFAGAENDINVLYLTDNNNGDALFVDDVFSELPDGMSGQSRIAQLKEICAGAGDDVIDMTSQRFIYSGDGVVIRGGNGNDTIWANKGENLLLGDAGADRLVGASGADCISGGSGNDSMHGGGGADIFTFCADWGKDTIEQLDGGSVTLWFESDIALEFSQIDGDTLISAADGSSILAKGLSLTIDNCRFGAGEGEYSEIFETLSDVGAFEKYSSTEIFAKLA